MHQTLEVCECGYKLYEHIAPNQGRGRKGRKHAKALICWDCGRLYKNNGDIMLIRIDGKITKIGDHQICIEG